MQLIQPSYGNTLKILGKPKTSEKGFRWMTYVVSQDVVLQLSDPARAGLILPAENEEGQELLVLLMPMLLND